MDKQLEQNLVVLTAGVVAAVAGVLGFLFADRELDPLPFDSVAWQDQAQVEEGVRLRMVDGLIARGTFVGKTRAEVVELLGEPPPTAYFTDWDLVYWLGPERGFGIDSEWLVLRLGSDGRVVDNRIVTD